MHSFLRYLGISFFLLFTIAHSAAQTAAEDSLTSLLINSTGSQRLEVLHELSNLLEDSEPNKALIFAQQGIALAEALNDSVTLTELYSSTAYSYTMLGNFPQALRRGFQTLRLSEKIHDKRLIASANSILGITYSFMGQYGSSLEHHFVALQIRKELGLTARTIRTLNNIGVVYYNMGQYEKAIQYYQQAIDLRIKAGDPLAIIRFLDNIGLAQTKLGKIKEAEKTHFRALAIAESTGYFDGMSYSCLNLGILYSENRDYEKAIGYLRRALSLYATVSQKHGMLQAYNILGEIYFKLHNDPLALQNLDSAIILAKESNVLPQLKGGYETLYKLYTRSGDTQKALYYLKLFSTAKDSLLTMRESNKIAELSVKFEVTKNENEIERLKSEAEISDLQVAKEHSRRNYYLGILLALVLCIPIFIVTYRRLVKSKKTVEQKHKELHNVHSALEEKINELHALGELIPICAHCKKIRDDHGFWERVDEYFAKRSAATFSHALCPECKEKLKM